MEAIPQHPAGGTEIEQLQPVSEALSQMLADREAESDPEELITLAIETSCDETSVAVLKGEREVLSNIISSSANLHQKFGGIVPEMAARAQLQAINPSLDLALRQAELTFWDISAVAVTIGPGLIGSLVVGVGAAKTLASVLDVPLVGVNHLEAHLYANLIEHGKVTFPAMGLIVSGGHTLLVHMMDHGIYEIVGQTLDDAAGEAYDKVARYLGLGFPGGPAIDVRAGTGDKAAISFPRALHANGYDFSFSGLKTAVLRHVKEETPSGDEDIDDLCASFQEAVADVLSAKTVSAAVEHEAPTVLLSGGVAANSRLRELLSDRCAEAELSLMTPSLELCTDNAAMVAACGYQRLIRGVRTGLDVIPDANLPLA